MAKIKSKTLTCPNCAAPVAVRNVLKAKTVVCRSCDSQIDMSKPNLEIMAQLRKQNDSHHGIIPGMKGTLPDGRSAEVVGRLRFEDSDIEETWNWDEWLLLSQNGEYLWLEEDEGRFNLLSRFDPDEPPELAEIESSHWLSLEGSKCRVEERGNPKIIALQGELTWKATLGDRTHYVDAKGGGQAYSIEWNDEEIEFFKRQRISRREALTTCGLDALLELDKELPALKREAGAGARNAGCSGLMAGAGAAVAAFGFFCGGAITSDRVGSAKHPVILAEQINGGQDLLSVNLNAGEAYTVFLDIPHYEHSLKHAEVTIDTPLTGAYTLWKIDNVLTTGHGRWSGNTSFVADSSGAHVVKLQGNAVEGTPLKSVDVHVSHSAHTFMGLLCFSPLLLAMAIGLFMLSAGRKSAAVLWVNSEMRKRRAKVINELHDAATVQE